MTGKKLEYHSIPYSSISHFSVETAGHFDRDAEMKIFIGSSDAPLERQFKRGFDIVVGVQKTLAHYVRLLEDVQVAISIADVGAAWQHGYDERLIRTIKEAKVYLSDY